MSCLRKAWDGKLSLNGKEEGREGWGWWLVVVGGFLKLQMDGWDDGCVFRVWICGSLLIGGLGGMRGMSFGQAGIGDGLLVM